MRTFSSFAFAACLSATLVACGGGSSPMGGGEAASKLTLAGTAATGLAIASAPVSAKCQTGSGTATTGSDGNYQLIITSGTLPCVLEVGSGQAVYKLALN